MWMCLVFLKLELKRAYKKFPQMFAGAIALLFLAGAIALLAGRALYGDVAAGRIAVGVILPEDALAKQMVSMIRSLDSVKSMCDFQYVKQEEAVKKLQEGTLSAVMDMPEGLIQGIMDGSNPSVRILLPGNAWLESRIFQELTEAGAKILGASQAGIYAGNELYLASGQAERIPLMEKELNQIFLSYSLPREDYFRHQRVSATGDVEIPVFYGISVYVLFLMLMAIPVSGYLLPYRHGMRQKLTLAGANAPIRVLGRILGLGSLFFTMSLLMGLLGKGLAELAGSAKNGSGGIMGLVKDLGVEEIFGNSFAGGKGAAVLPWAGVCLLLLLVCLTAAAFVVFLYQAAGSLLGGIMLLFLAVTAQHFLAGGFLPEVFLPEALRKMVPVMPSAVLMGGVQMAVTKVWSKNAAARLFFLFLAGFLLSVFLESRESKKG
ncbi:MAG: ABC transporter permease [Lachnospiraceae bacterium]|nr:ABC transporter permease [Lachnospiraceae bacterium]